MNSDYTFGERKLISVAISILMVCQSCKSYYANALSLDVAVNRGKSATIIFDRDEKSTFDFDKIVKVDSTYYGMNRFRGEWVKTAIQLEEGNDIYKNPSTFSMIAGTVVMGGLLVGLFYGIDSLGLGEVLFPEEED